MYCKHCGKQIAENALFCQFCGGNQGNTSNASHVISNHFSKENGNVFERRKIMMSLSDATKWKILAYGLWVVINLFFLIVTERYFDISDDFWPFEPDSSFNDYDFSEFVIYVFGLPLIIWGIVLYKKKIESERNSFDSTNSIKKIENINDVLGLK